MAAAYAGDGSGGQEEAAPAGEPGNGEHGESSAPPRRDSRGVRVAALALGAAIAIAGTLIFGAVYVRPVTDGPAPLVTVRIAGSNPFAADPAMSRALSRYGIQLQATSIGTQQIPGQPGLATRYDIAYVGSDDVAQRVQQVLKDRYHVTAALASPYSSPMLIVTYQRIVRLLETIGVVKDIDGILIFDIEAYLQRVVRTGMRWIDIRGNRAYPNKNRILVSTTDPATSNSGAMFAVIVSSAQLRDDPVTSVRPSDRYLTLARECFTEQGVMLQHTPDLLEEFLTDGIDRYPMALFYENDYIYARLSEPISMPPGLAVMYPDPTVISDHTFVAWTPRGERLTSLLDTNPLLLRLEEQDGYRTSQGSVQFVRYMAARGITAPTLSALLSAGVQTVPPPTDANLQALAEAVNG